MSRFVFPANGLAMPCWVRIETAKRTVCERIQVVDEWWDLPVFYEVKENQGNITGRTNHHLWEKIND